MKKPLSIIGPAAVALLFTLSFVTEAIAIDVYQFLVQYKNGRVAEKISTQSTENYKNCYEGYVANIVLLKKAKYSLQSFAQTFGRKNYHRLMTGHFGFGLEEKIILDRNRGGFDVNPQALPPPDGKSKALAKELNRILYSDRQKDDGDTIDPSTLPNPELLPPLGDDPEYLAKGSPEGKGFGLPVSPHPDSPEESDEKERYSAGIDVHRFLAEYINGKTVEKATAQLPEEYRRRYKGYVKKVTSLGKETYTAKKFKKTFGEKNYSLLIQGLFGKDETDIVMDNRIRRGIAPHPRALPAVSASKKSIQLAQKRKGLAKIQKP